MYKIFLGADGKRKRKHNIEQEQDKKKKKKTISNSNNTNSTNNKSTISDRTRETAITKSVLTVLLQQEAEDTDDLLRRLHPDFKRLHRWVGEARRERESVTQIGRFLSKKNPADKSVFPPFFFSVRLFSTGDESQ